jgi:hypothetical protein
MGLPVLLFSLLVKLEFMCNHNNRKILKAGGCGGPPGYEHLLEWSGRRCDPEKCDLAAVDRALKRVR